MAAAFFHAPRLSDVSFLAIPSEKDRLCVTDLLFLFSEFHIQRIKKQKHERIMQTVLQRSFYLFNYIYYPTNHPCIHIAFFFLLESSIKADLLFSRFYFNLAYCHSFQEHYLLSSRPLAAAVFIVKADLVISKLTFPFNMKNMKSK